MKSSKTVIKSRISLINITNLDLLIGMLKWVREKKLDTPMTRFSSTACSIIVSCSHAAALFTE
jgi:hypothetical protein